MSRIVSNLCRASTMVLANRLPLRCVGTLPRMLSSKSGSVGDVVFDEVNGRGIITLDKPKTLNAINLDMVCQILEKLKEWEHSMEMVIIRGGEKAFCSGGDIVAVTEGGPNKTQPGKEFFKHEYTMNHKISTYKVPYVALIHGITMGGGFGLSVHGKYRIATEKTLFAMPETAIGLFPDVGGTYILPRLDGQLGQYLALTGQRLKGVDVAKAGIATHFIPSEKLPVLLQGLIDSDLKGGKLDIGEEILAKHCDDLGCQSFSLAKHMDQINSIFSLPSLEEIMDALNADSSDWAKQTKETLCKMSPLSLKVSKKALEFGACLSLRECLIMENRISGHILEAKQSRDFYEGVRALLVDKDKNPKWCPASLEEVTDEMVHHYFTPLPVKGDELDL